MNWRGFFFRVVTFLAENPPKEQKVALNYASFTVYIFHLLVNDYY